MRLPAVLFASGLMGVMPACAQTTVASCPVVRPAAVDEVAQQRFVPYRLVRMRTTVQTLSNGTQITTRTESREWRDAEGRQRTEIRVERNGQMELQNISIFDPVLRENIGLHPRVQIADVNRLLSPPMYQPRAVDEEYRKAMQPEYQSNGTSHVEFKNEKLGTSVIAGECVEGNRSTQTFPAGEVGNDSEFQVVWENWLSPRLGMQFRIIRDDPRTGHYVEELTELHLEAPDPAMFQAPANYKVFDLTRDPAKP